VKVDCKLLLKEELQLIESALKCHQISQHPFINEVSEYVLFAGGKRVRPLLCVLSAKALNSFLPESLYEVAILFEYLHVATLLHDDVVDEAEFRRGRRSARRLWGNQATILVGDYLYAKALRIASALKNPEIMEVITRTTLLMSEGEVLQLLHLDDTEVSEEAYREIIYRKTAALISCACEVGALLAGNSDREVSSLAKFGYHLGLAFQMIDDLLDYTSLETGKDLGKDFAEGKITLPVILALNRATPKEREELIYLLKKKNTTGEDFQRAYFLIDKNEGFILTHKMAEEEIRHAKTALKELKDSPYREALYYLAEYLLNRRK